MANISTDNINTLAQLASSLDDGDYIYVFKNGASAFSRIEKSVFMQGMSGGISENDIIANLNSTSNNKALAASQGSVLKQAIMTLYNALSNSAFATARPTIEWGVPQTYQVTYGTMSHCSGGVNTEVAENNPFTVTLVPESGYSFAASGAGVIITMGGVNVTTNYFNMQTGVLSIPSVTGDIVIAATAAMPQTFNVSATLTHCQSDAPSTVIEGYGLNVLLTPDTGYSLRGDGASVVVLMGNVDITSTAYNSTTNRVVISQVTGNVSITVVAVETTDHTVNYEKLVQVNKVSGATSVEDGGTLSVELEQGSGFNGIFTNVGSTQKGLHVRDILVYMDDILLVQGVDYTAVQASLGSNITLTISNVTGNVLIMNVYFVVGIINHNNGSNVSSVYSLRTDNYIPIPKNCQGISVHHLYASSGNQGVVVYSDELGTRTAGAQYIPNEDTEITWESSAQSSYKYVRFCLYGGDNTHDPNKGFILNKTNSKYIWHGTNVTNE